MIFKAIIKSYDLANHQVAVQLIGSLSTYWPDIPVAHIIPSAHCTEGTLCAHLSFSDTDPTDAVVIATFTAAEGEPYTPPPTVPTSYDGGTAPSSYGTDDHLDGGVADSVYGALDHIDAGAAL
jgi:hypothetical protein